MTSSCFSSSTASQMSFLVLVEVRYGCCDLIAFTSASIVISNFESTFPNFPIRPEKTLMCFLSIFFHARRWRRVRCEKISHLIFSSLRSLAWSESESGGPRAGFFEILDETKRVYRLIHAIMPGEFRVVESEG